MLEESLAANLRKRDEVLFELLAQAAQVDHSVPSPEPIEGGPRLIGLGLFIQFGEIRNNRNGNAVRRARLQRSLTLFFWR
ncbi:MAG TPA: hypothetical protein VFE60_00450 [Roseiarcus sp.]|jgi:hypothetical protein|nr:hypothetical protein [Roseiarcus sp.]